MDYTQDKRMAELITENRRLISELEKALRQRNKVCAIMMRALEREAGLANRADKENLDDIISVIVKEG